MSRLTILLLLLQLIACDAVEKPHFYLNDASLRTFQSGDKISYAVLDQSIFNYEVTLNQKNEFSPDNTRLELLFEEQSLSNNAKTPFLPQYYQQDENNDLILKAIGNGGEILWLVDVNNIETEDILFPSDISSLEAPNRFTRKLLRCDQDQSCTNAGSYNLINLSLSGIETADTSYADFEAYKLDMSVEIEILDAENPGESKIYSFAGNAWFHPLIGIVKFIYNTKTPSSDSLLIGPLSSTNISIDEAFKTQN